MNDRLKGLMEQWEDRTKNSDPNFSLKSGGGGGTFDGMENRVKRLEDDMKEIRGDLKTLLASTAKIEGKIDGLPSAYEFGQLKGRVDSLPTTAKASVLLGMATAIIVIMNNWSLIAAKLFH